MLIMAEYSWFEKYKNRQFFDEYNELKNIWGEKCIEILMKNYPKITREDIELIDISTPLTIEHYLRSPSGAAVGLDVEPTRFVNPHIRDVLDPVTPVPGLYLTGQDTLICGATLCQLSGVITAFRMEGFLAALDILFKSVFNV